MESDEKIKKLTFISVVQVSFKSTQVLFIYSVEHLQAYGSYQNSERGHLKQRKRRILFAPSMIQISD